ncbi:MAG: polyprenyl synthetase family protein, partial [Microcystis sp. M53601_WE4]|nr:polyprenyl synthetase family protein [Microcystis sp. M53601_WE4]
MVTRGEQGVEVRKNESFSLASYLEEKRLIVESALDSSLVIGNPAKIYEAMRYSLL